MKRMIGAVCAAATLAVAPAAMAGIPTSQHLPAAACNQGTMNAHNHIPPVPGNGMNPNLARFNNQTNGHNAVPGTANVTPCDHGG